MATKGERGGGGTNRNLGLTDTNYYTSKRLATRIYCRARGLYHLVITYIGIQPAKKVTESLCCTSETEKKKEKKSQATLPSKTGLYFRRPRTRGENNASPTFHPTRVNPVLFALHRPQLVCLTVCLFCVGKGRESRVC